MRGPPSAETGTEVGGSVFGTDVVGVVDVVEDVLVVVDEGGGGFESPLLLHAPSVRSAAIVTRAAGRGRRTQRS
jgi:hypothetical protein